MWCAVMIMLFYLKYVSETLSKLYGNVKHQFLLETCFHYPIIPLSHYPATLQAVLYMPCIQLCFPTARKDSLSLQCLWKSRSFAHASGDGAIKQLYHPLYTRYRTTVHANWKYIKNTSNITNFVTSLSILRGHLDNSTSQGTCSITKVSMLWGQFINNSVTHNSYYYIIIIIKICSAHISTLMGAQGAETEKTWIQTIYSDSKNKIMYRDTCTMQLQIYIIFEKLWHKMSFKQRLKSSYTMTKFEFSWKMIPESRSRDRKRPITPGPFWSWFL